MKRTKALTLFIWSVIIITCILLLAAQLAGANVDPEQLRMVVFLPVVLQQCRIGQDCAVVEPTPQQPCDAKYWWECE